MWIETNKYGLIDIDHCKQIAKKSRPVYPDGIIDANTEPTGKVYNLVIVKANEQNIEYIHSKNSYIIPMKGEAAMSHAYASIKHALIDDTKYLDLRDCEEYDSE